MLRFRRWRSEVIVDVSEAGFDFNQHMSVVVSSLRQAYRVVKQLSPGPAGISFSPVNLSQPQWQPLLRVQQINNGNISTGELDKSFEVDGGQVTGGPNGDHEGKAFICNLDEKVREHLFWSRFIFQELTFMLASRPSCEVGAYTTANHRGGGLVTVGVG